MSDEESNSEREIDYPSSQSEDDGSDAERQLYYGMQYESESESGMEEEPQAANGAQQQGNGAANPDNQEWTAADIADLEAEIDRVMAESDSDEGNGPVQYEVEEHGDWLQRAQAEGNVVFANTVANPLANFVPLAAIPQGEDCAVCTDPLTQQPSTTAPCGHHFHQACIMAMTQQATEWRCPVCRAAW